MIVGASGKPAHLLHSEKIQPSQGHFSVLATWSTLGVIGLDKTARTGESRMITLLYFVHYSWIDVTSVMRWSQWTLGAIAIRVSVILWFCSLCYATGTSISLTGDCRRIWCPFLWYLGPPSPLKRLCRMHPAVKSWKSVKKWPKNHATTNSARIALIFVTLCMLHCGPGRGLSDAKRIVFWARDLHTGCKGSFATRQWVCPAERLHS